ncbi:MAG: stage IV sporulation protein A [Oscillospiraceae bacterium]|nr:stage IV sporulation protein A [Oscillospiraceae bacterium]
MEERSIYKDIAKRTNGDIYIGIVGPVRTGKSTFIKKFMDRIVIPNIESDFQRERANDELPQSSGGRTIMTTEPKFVPEEAIPIALEEGATFNVRLIDCVGYIVPSALGYVENEQPRMVQTPWFEKPIAFNEAAEIGTKKVITDHSTIGLVVTTDGTITDIPREEYKEAEERVISELQEIKKPFIVLLNTLYPESENAIHTAQEMSESYGVPVVPVNCLELDDEEIKRILSQILFEFPVKEIKIDMPRWVNSLEKDHWLRSSVFGAIHESAGNVVKIRDVQKITLDVGSCEYVKGAQIASLKLGMGHARITLELVDSLFYKVLGEKTDLDIKDETGLLELVLELSSIKEKFSKIRQAYDDVVETGYGIVMPSLDELTLEEPEIFKQGGKYGIRLKAAAPSIHMMKTKIMTEVTPMVGSEKQSEDLVNYLLNEFTENPSEIWQSNIFGKSLHDLVNEGLHNKLYRMPIDARGKICETIERIINDGCNGLICIIL